MTQAVLGPDYDFINLLSDNEDERTEERELNPIEQQHERGHAQRSDTQSGGNAWNAIDLTDIPDINVPPSNPGTLDIKRHGSSSRDGEVGLITEAECLQMVLNVLPAISVDYVLNLIREKTTDQTRTAAQCEQIVAQLLDGTHPTEADAENKKKRKREDDDGVGRYGEGELGHAIRYDTEGVAVLQNEFLEIPVKHITKVLKEQTTLFKAYRVLEVQARSYQQGVSPFVNIKKPRIKRDIKLILPELRSNTVRELQAVKNKSETETAERRKLEEAEIAEEANLQQAKLNQEMGECKCCFSECPLNRMISCDGDEIHFFCFDCFKQYVKTEIGQSHCRPICFATEDCHGMFSRRQQKQVLDEKTFDRLEHMQQQQDLAAAGLDFLSECPFCDFKMECPPTEVDREFRCQNKKCRKTSCRLCQQETHIPLSCTEAKKDGKLALRHIVEEAMSAALIRTCNRCKHPFVKEFGCNKMMCSHCGNVQCYVCSKNVTNYDHFGNAGVNRPGAKSCPLQEDVEARHEQEVKKAANEAMAKVKAENPSLSDADLMIKVSDRVKQSEAAQKTHGVLPMLDPFDPAQYIPLDPFVVDPVPFLQPINYMYGLPDPQGLLYPLEAAQYMPQDVQYPPRGVQYPPQAIQQPPRTVQQPPWAVRYPPRNHFPHRPNPPF